MEKRLFFVFFFLFILCLRDATVLGMLGLTSLGFLIDEARARLRYDEMLAFVLIGVFLVGVGDLDRLRHASGLQHDAVDIVGLQSGAARRERSPGDGHAIHRSGAAHRVG